MRAGRLKHKVTFQELTNTKNALGEIIYFLVFFFRFFFSAGGVIKNHI